MKIDQIHTFSTVVECGSISKAALILNKTQPAISMTIKRLEQTAGFHLFDRDGYRLKLTEKGKIYHQKCKLILEQIQQLNSYSDSLNQGEEHEVILSIEDSIDLESILKIIAPVQREFPNTQINIHAESQLKSLSLLNKQKVHLSFTPWLATFSSEGTFESKQVSTIEIGYCVHKSLLEDLCHNTNLENVEITEHLLAQLPQIVPSEFAISLDKNTLVRPIGRSLIRVNSYQASLAALKSRMGWGPIIKSPSNQLLGSDFLHFQVDKESSPKCAEIRVVKNKNKYLGPVAEKIWSLF